MDPLTVERIYEKYIQSKTKIYCTLCSNRTWKRHCLHNTMQCICSTIYSIILPFYGYHCAAVPLQRINPWHMLVCWKNYEEDKYIIRIRISPVGLRLTNRANLIWIGSSEQFISYYLYCLFSLVHFFWYLDLVYFFWYL